MTREFLEPFGQKLLAAANDICGRVEEKLDDIERCAETGRRLAILDEAIDLCIDGHHSTVARAPHVAMAFLDVAECLKRSRAEEFPDFYLAFAQIGLLRGAIIRRGGIMH